MEWGSNTGDAFTNNLHYDGFNGVNIDNFFLDINGDGLTDKIAVTYHWQQTINNCGKSPVSWSYRLRNHSNSFDDPISLGATPEDFFYNLIIGDFNGDGLDDFAYLRFNNISKEKQIIDRVAISNGSSFDIHMLPGSGIMAQNYPVFSIGDFDGDGKAEIILVKRESPNNTNNVFIYSFNDAINTFSIVFSKYIDFGNRDYSDAGLVIGDFNGDGKSDLMRTAKYTGNPHTSNCFIYSINLQSGNAEFLYGTPSNGYPTVWHQIYTGDFNGDGITDILTYNYTASNPVWEIGLFTGSGFVNMEEVPSIGHFNLHEQNDTYFHKLLLADFNNDGKTDILKLTKLNYADVVAYYDLYYSNGTSFPSTSHGSYELIGGFGSLGGCFSENPRENVSLVMDFNGDAYADFYISRGYYNDLIFLHNPSNNFNRVLSFTNGLGVKTEPEYLPLTNPLIYSKDTTAVYPLRDIQPPMYVVSGIKREKINANSSQMSELYTYHGAKVHLHGKGFMGFKELIVKSVDHNTITKSTNTIYPFYYYPYNSSSKTWYSDSKDKDMILSQSFNLMNHHTNTSNQKIFFPYIIISKTSSMEFSSQNHQLTIKNISNYDDYGNLILHTELSDSLYMPLDSLNEAFSHEKTTEATFSNDLTHWLFRPEVMQTKVRYHTEPYVIQKNIYEYYSYGNPSFPLLKKLTNCPSVDQNNPLSLETVYLYDAYGNLIKQILSAPNDPNNPEDRSVLTTYSTEFKHRLPTSTTNAMGYSNTYSYDDLYGNLVFEIDANDLIFNYTTHPMGVESCVTFPDQTMTCNALRWASNHPDAPENATYYSWRKSSGQAEIITFFHKTGAQLRTISTGYNGSISYTDIKYDNKNRSHKVTSPYFKNTSNIDTTYYYYDDIGRKSSIVNADGTITAYEYDNISISTVLTGNNLNQISKQCFNAAGWLMKSIDAIGVEVNYNYFSDGKLHQTMVVSQPNTLVKLNYNDRRQRTLLNDPNYGQMITTYNAFDEPLSQTNPKGQTETYVYDILGRMTQSTNVTGITTWVYNNNIKKGTLASVSMPGHSTTFVYDELLRLQLETENILGQSYTTQYTYDGFGRPLTTTYPSGYATKQVYNSFGYNKGVADNQTSQMLYEVNLVNALGQLNKSTTGNGYITNKTYFPLTYRLKSVKTEIPGNQIIQDMEYGWTANGNLNFRKKWISRPQNNSITESFTYDNLNRLLSIYLNGSHLGMHQYDAEGLGNLSYKKTDGQVLFQNAAYGQNTAGPHALTSATTSAGIFPPEQQSIAYNAFDKVTSITEGDKSLQITYGHRRQRISQQYTAAGSTTTKVYVGACEYITTNGQTTTHTYLSGPEGLFALHVKNPNGSENIRYIHTDHLGSWNTITGENGNLLQELSFDAWGNRRNPNTWRAFTGTPPLPMFDRGFTGHEHLYGFQLINMNGRMYDPVVSRMLSPDNFVQAPDFSQSFNRYSYAWNNPLVYTDPSGELLFIIPYLSFNASGGLDFGVTVGVGIPGVLSAQATVGHSTSYNNTYFTIGGTASGITGTIGWGTQIGYTASVGFGLSYGIPIPGVGSNLTSAGINWSQHGGMSVGAFGFSMDSQGIGFNPSLGYSHGFNINRGPIYQPAMYACKGCPTYNLPEVNVVGSRWTFNHGPVSDNTYLAPYQVNYGYRTNYNSRNTTSNYEWAGRANTMYNLYNPNIISRTFSVMYTGAALVEQYNNNDYLGIALTIGEVAADRNGYVTIAKTVADIANSPSTQREVSGLLQRDAQFHYQMYQKTGSTWHYNQYMRYRSAVETARRKF